MNLNLEGIYHQGDEYAQDPGPSRQAFRGALQVKQEPVDFDDISTEISTIQSRIQSLEQKSMLLDEDEGAVEEWHAEDQSCEYSLAINDAMTQLLTDMINKVEKSLDVNKQKQKAVQKRLAIIHELFFKKKTVPIQQYLPPYFKDEHNMCAPMSDEARTKLMVTEYDPLTREEKRWNSTEIQRLKSYVRKAMIDVYVAPLVRKRDELYEKVKHAGAETDAVQMHSWRDEWDAAVRKINYQSQMSLEDLAATVDANEIDWAKMANIDFGGQRSPFSLRLKWFNEVSPRWNQKPWTKEEAGRLKQLVENEKFISWPVVAEKLGSDRTPWQCFEKYKTDMYQEPREWTPEEDEKLITLCNIIKINGQIQWDKVTYYMPGRSRTQVRVRFSRTLDKSVKHGKWTDQEDLLLMCAVNRYGAVNWKRVAKSVPGRTDTQCRERWTGVLDKRQIAREWTLEDDEKLIYLINELGRHSWAKFAQFMNRTGDQCRSRFLSLLNTKITLLTNARPRPEANQMSDFEMRNTLKKLRLNRIYRKFNNMMASIDGQEEPVAQQEGIDKLMDVVEAKEIEAKMKVAKSPQVAYRRKLPLDVVAEITAGLAAISQRYVDNQLPEMNELLAQIPVEEADIHYHTRRKQTQRHQKAKRRQVLGESMRKTRKVVLRKTLQEDPEVQADHDRLMAGPASERKKVEGMYQILVDAVSRLDAHEYATEFAKYWQETGATIARDLGREILTHNLDEDVEKSKKGESLRFESTLPVSYTNSDMFTSLQKNRPLLLKNALECFHRVDSSIDDPNKRAGDNGEYSKAPEPTNRLVIRLTPEVTQSDEYHRTKVLLRNAIIEPMLFEAASMSRQEYDVCQMNNELAEYRSREEQDVLNGRRIMPVPRVDYTETGPSRRRPHRPLKPLVKVDGEVGPELEGEPVQKKRKVTEDPMVEPKEEKRKKGKEPASRSSSRQSGSRSTSRQSKRIPSPVPVGEEPSPVSQERAEAAQNEDEEVDIE